MCTATGRAPLWAASCASCTCATTSRTTSAGSGYQPHTGTMSSARRRSGASDPDVILKGRVDTEPDNTTEDVEGEVVDGLPVLSDDAPPPEPLRSAALPVATRQAAALAATG